MSKLTRADDKGFNGKISQCLDKALDTLGQDVKIAFYYQIEEKYHVPRGQIPTKPKEAIEYLRAILGATGYSFVEKLIVREIQKMFGLEFKGNLPLTSAISEARKKFLNISDSSRENS
jgi:hypothetical protein